MGGATDPAKARPEAPQPGAQQRAPRRMRIRMIQSLRRKLQRTQALCANHLFDLRTRYTLQSCFHALSDARQPRSQSLENFAYGTPFRDAADSDAADGDAASFVAPCGGAPREQAIACCHVEPLTRRAWHHPPPQAAEQALVVLHRRSGRQRLARFGLPGPGVCVDLESGQQDLRDSTR